MNDEQLSDVDAPNGNVPELRSASDILLARLQFARLNGITFNGARDEYEVLGYQRLLTVRDFREEYQRGGIAGRVVDVMPDATWRGSVELREDKDEAKDTPFEKAWKALDKKHQIQAKMMRVDKLSRLSTYAVLLIGALGDLNTELPKAAGPNSLLYLMPFSGGGGPGGSQASRSIASDADCSIFEYENDASNPRFGMPRTYQLRRTDISSPMLQKPVHWTRILHVAEGLLDDEVFGMPALERIWNLLIDLRKVTGGGAEAFWLRANAGMHLDIDKGMALPDVKDTLDKLKDQTELYKHQMTRMMRTRGVDIKQLGSDVANFATNADAIITQIAGAKGIPKRILTGSEMGELASSQDRENFKDLVNGRQTGYAGPYMMRPLIDRFVQYNYLPTPAGGPDVYEVVWPHIQALTEQEKADGALKWAQVNAAMGVTVFTDAEIRDKWYSMAEGADEATEIWKANLALKMAEVNKSQGAVVITDDEIRKTCYGWSPLTPDQKIPLTAPERVSTTAPTPLLDEQGRPKLDAAGKPIVQAPPVAAPVPPAFKAAEEQQLAALEAAIESSNLQAIARILELTS